jgi:hypothetical protein
MAVLPYPVRRDGINAVVLLHVYAEGDEIVCGLKLSGTFPKPTKAVRRAFREELAKIEALAKASGVTEMRHAGEDRAVFLPGYEPMNHPALRNGRRKRL